MAHFYRGELGRMTAWRERFDTTTHWAIIAVTGIITFAWTNSASSHLLFLFSNTILYLLLSIEARRYRFYDAYRARVRILESHLILPELIQEKTLQGDWRKLLGSDLLMPTFKISYWEALSRRFTRNYVWLFLITLVAWSMHILTLANGKYDLQSLAKALTKDQPLPLPALLTIVVGFYIYLICLGFLGIRKRGASGEFQKRPSYKSRDWSI